MPVELELIEGEMRVYPELLSGSIISRHKAAASTGERLACPAWSGLFRNTRHGIIIIRRPGGSATKIIKNDSLVEPQNMIRITRCNKALERGDLCRIGKHRNEFEP